MTREKEFVQLIAARQKLIHSVCCLYYSSAEDRKDLFQEIVLQLWKSYPLFKQQSAASTWIYRVALNTVLSKIRKEKALPRREFFSEKLHQIPAPDTLQSEEAVEELYQAISRLSATDKAVVVFYLEGHRHEEIAVFMGITKTNLSTRINRIKSRLGKLLKTQSL